MVVALLRSPHYQDWRGLSMVPRLTHLHNPGRQRTHRDENNFDLGSHCRPGTESTAV